MNITNIAWDIESHSLIIRIKQVRLESFIIPKFFKSKSKSLKGYEEYAIQFPLLKDKEQASLLVFLESFLTYQEGECIPNLFLWISESQQTSLTEWIAVSPEFSSFIKGIAPVNSEPYNIVEIEKEMQLANSKNTVFRVLQGGNFSMQADGNFFIKSAKKYTVSEQSWNVYYSTTHRTTRQSLAFIIGLAMIASAMQ